ncbi:hypothetical protein BT63DRAFT_228221 [Microthyrium microscopicum]|uniref:Uncharacterized protein n=1 Tax=Microthyrium microscopicum TaxID=703497 RepID=A0A6A6UEX8_9PEZI|nr:hypothetical protein BT63DRAFT_228221 [Microthyrium microscopicum]
MGLFRSRKAPASDPPEPSSPLSWTTRLNPFSRSSSRASSHRYIEHEDQVQTTLRRSNTTSTQSYLSPKPSNASSRPPTSMGLMTPSPTSSIPPIPRSATYPHRSHSIRRDSSRIPPSLPRNTRLVVPQSRSPLEVQEDDLVLTATVRPYNMITMTYLILNSPYTPPASLLNYTSPRT